MMMVVDDATDPCFSTIRYRLVANFLCVFPLVPTAPPVKDDWRA